MKTMKRKLCAILCAAMLAGVLIPTVSAATFSDVSGHWAASYIEACAGRGIVDGVGGGKFNPEGRVTNAEFVKMLCTAFYGQEQQTYEAANRATMDAYFGGNAPWYGYRSYYFYTQGLLNSVDYNVQSVASANQPMNRTNMAQVAANVLTQKGINASEDDKALAQAKLIYVSDYYNIPKNNRDAVKTCYALGIITGTDGGKFDGENTMTRAQACTVITRLLDVVGKGPTPDPEPIVPTLTDIEITTKPQKDSKGITETAYFVADNGFPTGYLNNGMPITEENVHELLLKANEIWPDELTWGEIGTPNNHWYGNKGMVITYMPDLGGGSTESKYRCSGFAMMLSDYLFGKNNNPWHKVTNFADLRPGDIIIRHSTPGHAMVVVDTVKTGDRAGAVFIAHGNVGDKVSWDKWPEILQELDEPWAHWYSWLEEDMTERAPITMFSRWPQ